MALAGLHVVCAYAGGRGFADSVQSLIANPQWSETMAAAGTTAKAASAEIGSAGFPMFRVRTSADVFVAVGSAPNASTGTRLFIPAGVDYDIIVKPNDRLAWVLA